MDALVISSFHHTNTGVTWYAGQVFHGDACDARQLADLGYLKLPGTQAVAAPEGPAYAAMTVSELRALCADRGIDVPSRARKADLVALLEGD